MPAGGPGLLSLDQWEGVEVRAVGSLDGVAVPLLQHLLQDLA